MARLYYERLKATYFDLLEKTESTPLIDWSDRSSGPIRDEQIEDAIVILRYRLNVQKHGQYHGERKVIDTAGSDVPTPALRKRYAARVQGGKPGQQGWK